MKSRTGLRTRTNKKTVQGDTIPSFNEAYNKAQKIDETSYHKPSESRCGCTKTTDKGAYADVTAKMQDMTVYFYHQSPVVVEHEDGTLRLDSCGYQTQSTKKRINNHTPDGYKVRKRGGDWYIDTPTGRKKFEDGMDITVKERTAENL